MQNLIFDVSANPVAAQTYKEYLGGVDWVQTSTVVISGIVIVMLVLVILIAIFKGFGKAAEGGKNLQKGGAAGSCKGSRSCSKRSCSGTGSCCAERYQRRDCCRNICSYICSRRRKAGNYPLN